MPAATTVHTLARMSVDWGIVALAVLVYLPNLYGLYLLWFRVPGSWAKKLLISAALLIPVIGLLWMQPAPNAMNRRPTPVELSYQI